VASRLVAYRRRMPIATPIVINATAAPSQNTCVGSRNRAAVSSRTPQRIVPIWPGTPSWKAITWARRRDGTVL
jgi:hypothetical protein